MARRARQLLRATSSSIFVANKKDENAITNAGNPIIVPFKEIAFSTALLKFTG
jgi:hypothetical protein